MYITKHILNQKLKKSMEPHKRQILNQINSSISDQNWRINKEAFRSDRKQKKFKPVRPKTANVSIKKSVRPSTAALGRYSSTQQLDKRSNSFVKKINYQFNEIKEITSLFDNFFEQKKSKLQPEKMNFPEKVQNIKTKIKLKQKQQKINFQKIKRERSDKINQNQGNQYIGYPKEKVNKIIPVFHAKNQNIHMLTRCIKGGYVQQRDQFSDIVSKSQLLKLKKNFITLNTLYENVKGKKSKGIKDMKPQNVDKNSFQNLVYFLENERHLKLADKMIIQEKIKLIT